MTALAINPGDTVELGLPAWIAKEKGFASREVAGEVLKVTAKALQVRAHVTIRESETCHNCGREIDNPASRLLGFGPVCSDRLGLPHAETYAVMSPAEREEIRNRVSHASVVECWLPLSQVVVRKHEPKVQDVLDHSGDRGAAPAFDAGLSDDRARWAKADAYLNEPCRVAANRAGWENGNPAVPAPEAPAPNPRRVVWAAGAYRIVFPYDQQTVTAVKRISGYAFKKDPPDPDYPQTHWRVPETSGADVLRFAAEHGFEVEADAAAQADVWRQAAEQNLAESRAAVAEFHVDGLGGTLRPFQMVGTQYAVRQRRVIIGDEMRLGKTPQSLATVHATDAYPALFIVPATLKPAWRREATKWLPGRTVAVLDGKATRQPENWVEVAPAVAYADRYEAWFVDCWRQMESAEVCIINYDILMDWAGVEWTTVRDKRVVETCSGPLAHVAFRAMVCDEFHKHLLGRKAQRTQVLQFLAARWRARCREQTQFDMVQLLLSGTPMKKKATDLMEPLKIIGRLEDVGGWREYASRYCGYANGIMGALPVPSAALVELNTRLRSVCLIRRRRKDVFAEIPKVERHVVPFAIDNRAEYQRAERDVVGWAAEHALKDREFNESLEGRTPEEQKAMRTARMEDAAFKAQRAEGLVRIGALKKLAAHGKMAAVVEWVGNFLEESGEKLIIGAWHQEIVEELATRFNAPFIHGGVSAGRKDRAVLAFQRCADCGRPHELHYNPESNPGTCQEYRADMGCAVIAINFLSGGMGLTLTAANDTVIVELGWTPDDMDQMEMRVGHIDKMDPANHWYLLAEDTIEEDIVAVLDGRRREVGAATDGEGREEERGMMEELLERMAARAATT